MPKSKIAIIFTIAALFVTGCTTQPASSTTNTPNVYVLATDFTKVCNGEGMDAAAGYDTSAAYSPVLVFERDDSNKSYTTSYGSNLPDEWEPSSANPAEAQLVACATAIESTKESTCDFEKDGTSYKLNMYSAKYEIKLYEAKTAKELATKTVELEAEECPLIHFFNGTEEDDFPSLEQPLTDFVKPFVKR